jgi:hypothetical protein
MEMALALIIWVETEDARQKTERQKGMCDIYVHL